MLSIDELRRYNMATLRDEHGGVKALADSLSRSESQVSQWINGAAHSATGKPREMKTSTARWIEKLCGKTLGWLDIDHEAEPSNQNPLAARLKAADAATRALVEIALMQPDEPLPEGLSPSVRTMVEMVRAALREELKKRGASTDTE